MFKENLVVIGRKNFRDNTKKIDYFLRDSVGREEYLFTKNYSNNSYNLCKGGVRINTLLVTKNKDYRIMRLVEHLKRFVPCLKQEYGFV